MPKNTAKTLKPLEACADEMLRELNVRKRVYGRWIDKGSLTISDAKHQIDCVESIMEYLAAHKDYQVGYEPVDRTERKEIALPWDN